MIDANEIKANKSPYLYPCIYNTPPVVNPKAENAATYGQGDGSTK
jgi:hypothetical protein